MPHLVKTGQDDAVRPLPRPLVAAQRRVEGGLRQLRHARLSWRDLRNSAVAPEHTSKRMLSLLMGLGAASVNDREWPGSGRIALAEWNVDFLLGYDHNRSGRNPPRLARSLDDQRRHAKGRFIRNPTLPGVLANDGFVPRPGIRFRQQSTKSRPSGHPAKMVFATKMLMLDCAMPPTQKA